MLAGDSVHSDGDFCIMEMQPTKLVQQAAMKNDFSDKPRLGTWFCFIWIFPLCKQDFIQFSKMK